jgi:hypothetical protein
MSHSFQHLPLPVQQIIKQQFEQDMRKHFDLLQVEQLDYFLQQLHIQTELQDFCEKLWQEQLNHYREDVWESWLEEKDLAP